MVIENIKVGPTRKFSPKLFDSNRENEETSFLELLPLLLNKSLYRFLHPQSTRCLLKEFTFITAFEPTIEIPSISIIETRSIVNFEFTFPSMEQLIKPKSRDFFPTCINSYFNELKKNPSTWSKVCSQAARKIKARAKELSCLAIIYPSVFKRVEIDASN
ncbi:unnamed protein product [Dovyalis caffra]|uniref:Uncharacterized protein n=1 Tax=Dovyalis caffra TaxID=77055 RepID=A0AAV1R0S9_9ROSI|nr:unnamed protein product [Dovyalis caffra]